MPDPSPSALRTAPWWWWSLGLAVLALGVGPALVLALDVNAWQREVDLEVYRAAGQSLLHGRDLYTHLTDVPNLLPFTYPPFAAVLAVPLAMVPFGVAQGLWAAAQVAMVGVIVALSARPLLDRCGETAPVAWAALVTAAVWTLPVSDGLFFGQVGVLLCLLCLLDVRRVVSDAPGRPHPGALSAVAAAVKLTPALFAVQYLLARKWRAGLTSAAVAAGITLGAAVLFPRASMTYWGTTVFDSKRIGDPAITYNGSLAGMADRLGPHGPEGSYLWGLIGALVTAYGLWVGARLLRSGESVLAVAVVGMLTVLLSPIAWLHHMTWFVPGMLGLVGDARSKVRVALAGLLWLVLDMPLELPWRGSRWLANGEVPRLVARLAQSSFPICAVLLMVAAHLLVLVPQGRRAEPASPAVVPEPVPVA
ncbi:alpha-1,2-mannosyltransferase [Motilibacter rhizosphaerae]|uniref:Alpha-1,2-mannosyltransferase n=1 Tax=Motilibacter rhizosphaerae TaxID=598652 RepID=A0A4Q7NVM2_9ACTN|nr:glycosyltransferase 87 family protein [Motilibacter rhizosphaerae]RZS91301.1 alpha-1,2-mannosyltransferase [Motilibacter rhizosphaerae]